MTLTKVHNESENYIIVEQNSSKFIMEVISSDLYWTMLNYTVNNKFIVTKDTPELWEFLTVLFKDYHFKNCTFLWNSESNGDQQSNKLKITKGEKYFKIKFIQTTNNTTKEPRNSCPVCFCLNGDKNTKIAEDFSNLLHKLLTRD